MVRGPSIYIDCNSTSKMSPSLLQNLTRTSTITSLSFEPDGRDERHKQEKRFDRLSDFDQQLQFFCFYENPLIKVFENKVHTHTD